MFPVAWLITSQSLIDYLMQRSVCLLGGSCLGFFCKQLYAFIKHKKIITAYTIIWFQVNLLFNNDSRLFARSYKFDLLCFYGLSNIVGY